MGLRAWPWGEEEEEVEEEEEEEEEVCCSQLGEPAGFVTCCLQRSGLQRSPAAMGAHPSPRCSPAGESRPKEEENTGREGVPGLPLRPAAPVTHLALKNTSSSFSRGPALPPSSHGGSPARGGPAPRFRPGLPGLHPSAPQLGAPVQGLFANQGSRTPRRALAKSCCGFLGLPEIRAIIFVLSHHRPHLCLYQTRGGDGKRQSPLFLEHANNQRQPSLPALLPALRLGPQAPEATAGRTSPFQQGKVWECRGIAGGCRLREALRQHACSQEKPKSS